MRFSGLSWTKDGKGFFYARYPEPPAGKVFEAALSGHALYYHALGTPQTLDRLIYTNADNPSWFVGGVLTDDGRYLLVSTSKGADNNNRLYLKDLADPLKPASTPSSARSSKKTMRSCRLSAATSRACSFAPIATRPIGALSRSMQAIRLSHGRR